MNKLYFLTVIIAVIFSFTACNNIPESSDLGKTDIDDEVVEESIDEVGEDSEISEDSILSENDFDPTHALSSIQFMSEQEAAKITDGKLTYMPEYNYMVGGYSEYKAYLTPSGKLVYMTDFEIQRLEDTTDFEVNWGLYDLGPLNIRTDYISNEEDTVFVSANLSDKTAVKYDLFVEYFNEFTTEIPELYGFQCYAKVASGTLFFDLGLTIDNPDFADYDVTYTFTGAPYYEPQTLKSKVGQTVYIEDIYRIYPFDADVEWNISAEIKDADGNTVYTENCTVYESFNPYDNTFFITKGEKTVQ